MIHPYVDIKLNIEIKPLFQYILIQHITGIPAFWKIWVDSNQQPLIPWLVWAPIPILDLQICHLPCIYHVEF